MARASLLSVTSSVLVAKLSIVAPDSSTTVPSWSARNSLRLMGRRHSKCTHEGLNRVFCVVIGSDASAAFRPNSRLELAAADADEAAIVTRETFAPPRTNGPFRKLPLL